MSKNYLIGTDEQQAYMQDYNWNIKGYAFLEPGVVALDSKQFAAFNVAKSFYQIYPEVFNLKYISEKTGLSFEDIKKRIKKMYDEKVFMLVVNSAVGVEGFGLYYWVVKLKKDASAEDRARIAKWVQDNDQICTSTSMDAGGDFDFYNGNHMRNIDNLVGGVLDKVRFDPCVEYVHICPVRRLIREINVNQFDAKDNFRHFFISDEQVSKLMKIQNKIDVHDIDIIKAINNTETVADMFDYDVLARLSGLDADEMRNDFVDLVDTKKIILPAAYINYRALGLKEHFFLVSMFQFTPTFLLEAIADKIATNEELTDIFEFGDAHHNLMLSCFEGITDVDKIRQELLNYAEIDDVLEASSSRQLRRWTCRLDDDNGLWEECVFTDDLLVDRMSSKKDGE